MLVDLLCYCYVSCFVVFCVFSCIIVGLALSRPGSFAISEDMSALLFGTTVGITVTNTYCLTLNPKPLGPSRQWAVAAAEPPSSRSARIQSYSTSVCSFQIERTSKSSSFPKAHCRGASFVAKCTNPKFFSLSL